MYMGDNNEINKEDSVIMVLCLKASSQLKVLRNTSSLLSVHNKLFSPSSQRVE